MEPIQRPALSAVFPARDEEENIVPFLSGARAALSSLFDDFEMVVVDDGSADGTARRIGDFIVGHPETRLLRHETSRGYGAALKTGIASARGELIFFTDSDGQFDIAELRLLAAWIDRFDIVAGYRARRRDPVGRRLLAWAWSRLVRATLGLEFRDINCAFKLFRRRVFDEIPIESVGAFINTEILARARSLGLTWTQVPVTHYPRQRGRQSGARPRVILRALTELWRFRRQWGGEGSRGRSGVAGRGAK